MKYKSKMILSLIMVLAILMSACKPNITNSPTPEASSEVSSSAESIISSDDVSEQVSSQESSEDSSSESSETEVITPWTPDSSQAQSSVSEEEPVVYSMYFGSHAFIYSADASVLQKRIALELDALLNQKYYMSETYNDTEDEKDYEILVGNTNREESVRAYNEITQNRSNNAADFIVRVDNGKIVINAVTDQALEEAVQYFLRNYCKTYDPYVPDDLDYFYKPALNASLGKIGTVDFSTYKIVMPRDRSYIYSRQVDELVNYIRKTTGKLIPVVDDRTSETNNEILVGKTNRDASNVTLSEEGYVLKQTGTKIVALGSTDLSTEAAVKLLVDKVKKSVSDSSKVEIPAGLNVQGEYTPPDKDYVLVWNDEFNAELLDTKTWTRLSEAAAAWNGGTLTRTNSLENSRLENGNLVIYGLKTGESTYTSAKLSTQNGMNYTYGYIEIRARLPQGKGVWPGFWMGSSALGYPGGLPEVDVLESFGDSVTIYSNLHKWWWDVDSRGKSVHMHEAVQTFTPASRAYRLPEGEIFRDAYHTFGFEWTPEYIAFYIDGYKYASVNILEEGMDVFHKPIYVILSMAVGLLAIPGPDENTPFPAVYEIDYIRLYQVPGVGVVNIPTK